MSEQRTLGGLTPTKPSKQREEKGPTIVLMGPQTAGKTTLLKTLLERPELTMPLAVIDMGGGSFVLPDHPDIDPYLITNWAQIEKIEQDVAAGRSPYKSIAWDVLTQMQLAAQDAADVFDTDNPQVRATRYGEANRKTLELATSLQAHSQIQGINMIFIVWTETVKENGVDKVVMDLSPTFRRQFTGVIDYVFYLEPNAPPKPYPGVMRTGGSNVYTTRTRIAEGSPMAALPPIIYQPSLSSIIATFHGEPWPTEKHAMKIGG